MSGGLGEVPSNAVGERLMQGKGGNGGQGREKEGRGPCPKHLICIYLRICSGVVVGHTGHTPYDHYLFLQNSV